MPKNFLHVYICCVIVVKKISGLNEELWRQLDVKFQTINEQNLSEVSLFYFEQLIFPELKNRLRKIVMLKGSTIIGGYKENCNQSQKIPLKYQQSFIGDLLVFTNYYHDDFKPNFISKICNIDQNDSRPNIGWIDINLRKISLNYKNSEVLINQLLHQTFHILAFSQNIINFFQVQVDPNQQKTIKNEQVTLEVNMLQTPILVKNAIEHFGCDNIQGVVLQKQQDFQGIHFERVYQGNELMTINEFLVPKISKLSLGLLEDSGWYKVNYAEVQELKWGKKKGCDFIEQPCDPKFDEFCTQENQVQCSVDYKSKTICKKSDLTDQCYYKESKYQFSCTNEQNFQFTVLSESPGMNSRCFNIKKGQETAGCFKSFCYNNKIIIKIEDQEYSCTEEGSEIVLQNQTLICPNIQKFCKEFNKSCYQDCNGHGECLLNNQCRCYLSYYGKSCEFQEDCQNSNSKFCEYISLITPTKQKSQNKLIEIALIFFYVLMQLKNSLNLSNKNNIILNIKIILI